jgi:hypothetical protein
MTMIDRLRHEMRLLGLGTFGLPLLAALVFTGVSALAAYDARNTGGSQALAHDDIAKGLLLLLEFGLPPVAGLLAAYLVTGNPTLELHLALPRSYAAVIWLRLTLLTLWCLLAAALTSAAISAAGYWIAPQADPRRPLIWAAPMLWFVAGGAMLSLLLRSRVASGAVLGMVWLGELFLRAYFLQNSALQKIYLFLTLETLPGAGAPASAYWLANRLTLLAMAALFLAALAFLLRRDEALLGHET